MASSLAINPIGRDTYAGLAVSLLGDSIIRQQAFSSVNTILTLMHSTANTGNFISVMDYKSDIQGSSILTGHVLLDIDADGGLRAMDGTTVLMELDTSGLYDGSTQLINSSGEVIIRQPVVAMTTGANYSPTTVQSGTLFTAGTNDGTSQLVLLPVNPSAGTWFDFYVSTQDAAGDFQLNTTADSSAKIHLPGMTSLVSSGDAIEPLTTEGHNFVRMTALSSVLWMAHTVSGYAGAATTDFKLKELSAGHWGAATTAS